MLNEELIHRALGILLDRYNYFSKQTVFCQEHGYITEMDAAARASAYKSAYDILWFAIIGNEKNLKKFDCYNERN